MTSKELATIKNKLGWSGAALARALDVSPSTVWRWLRGESAIPGPVALYLDCVLCAKLDGREEKRPTMYATLTNKVHGTSYCVEFRDGATLPQVIYKQARKALCGVFDCDCPGVDGETIDGYQVHVIRYDDDTPTTWQIWTGAKS